MLGLAQREVREMAETVNKRSFGLDLVRAAAGVLVLSVHFFLNNGFYQTPAAGGTMLLACVVRMGCMTCVPLFLVLTGYTCVNREWSKGYYFKLLPVLLTYLGASAVCLAFRALVLQEAMSPLGMVRRVLDFSAAPYAWYIEMYIGLFLLSPFVNAAWKALSDKAKGALVATLFVMTALPGLTNHFGQILPEWWTVIYPLTYYVIGAWLRERPLKAKSWQLLLAWAALAAAMGAVGYFGAKGGVYSWLPEDNWGSWSLTLQAALLFSALVRVKTPPKPVRWLVERLAKLSLGMYLTSYVADQIVYPKLAAAVPAAHQRLWWMLPTVFMTVTISCLLAQAIQWLTAAVMRGLSRGRCLYQTKR